MAVFQDGAAQNVAQRVCAGLGTGQGLGAAKLS